MVAMITPMNAAEKIPNLHQVSYEFVEVIGCKVITIPIVTTLAPKEVIPHSQDKELY